MSFDPKPPANEAAPPAEPYVYPPAVAPGTAANPSSSGANSSTLERLWNSGGKMPSSPSVDEEQIRTREAQARKEGRDEGAAQAKAEFEKKLAGERQILADAVRQFARDRETYFNRVEAELVGLALAIARKILHREAQLDPLLLAGVVRVGLEKVASGTRVRLRVHPDQIQGWQKFFSQQTDLKSLPELMGDATLGSGHCMLETELGSTDLTLESQLKEIEQGFFDLLAQRPKV